MPPTPKASLSWWKTTVVYQIYPKSFKDSNSDCHGDIPGIIQKLEYIKDLGVGTIRSSPTYPSPQKDGGYDISKYEDVDPIFGTLNDMDDLIREVHARGMRLILDLVITHTSDQHAWFQESKSSCTNKKSDWYIWSCPLYVGGERRPSYNWGSCFGGCGWEYVPERDQYYFHAFDATQPDLNWESEVVRIAIYNSAIRFWLERGIDGFRVDVVNFWSESPGHPNVKVRDPEIKHQPPYDCIANGTRMPEFLQEIRNTILKNYGDILMVGELPWTSFNNMLPYITAANNELNIVFDFNVAGLGGSETHPTHLVTQHTLPEFKKALSKPQGFP